MKKIRNVLRLHRAGLSNEKVAICAGVSKGSVKNTLRRALVFGVTLEKANASKDSDLKALLYPSRKNAFRSPDYEKIADELQKDGANLQLLWEEYREAEPNGMGRTSFYEGFRDYKKQRDPELSMHQDFKGGEFLFLDYSGLRVHYVDPSTGEQVKCELFLGSWGASSYTYVEASPTQRQEDWIVSNVNALRYFGCSPVYLTPDNLKSAVIKADYYDPKLNMTYEEMSSHYDCAVLPAKSYRPKYKAVVEANVRAVQYFIIGRLRNFVAHSLKELNAEIWRLLKLFNDRIMQGHKKSRTERFEELDFPFATKLPKEDFTVSDIKTNILVGKDYHVFYRDHYYSVPWSSVGQRVDVHLMAKVVQIYYDGERLTSHLLAPSDRKYSTLPEHRPPHHKFVANLNPMWVLDRASRIGPETLLAVRNLIDSNNKHFDVAVRKSLGIVRLADQFPKERVELAVSRALRFAQVRPSDIQTILEQGLDKEELKLESDSGPVRHQNIRGSKAFYDLLQEEEYASGTNSSKDEKHETISHG